MRPVLEAALATHSALSEGAWIRVPFGGGAFELLVQKLRPGRAVSVIGGRACALTAVVKLLLCMQEVYPRSLSIALVEGPLQLCL